MRVPATDIPEK